MADLTRRASKRLAGHLLDDEVVIAALLCEPRGSYGVGSIALAAMPRTTMRILDERAGDERAGMASRLPASSFVLAVTTQRVVVSASNGIAFAAPGPVFDWEDLCVGEVVRKGLGRRMTLLFADGSATDVDLQRGQPIDRVGELLGVGHG